MYNKNNTKGIYDSGKPTITNCEITNNSQYGIYSSTLGGGYDKTLKVTNNHFNNNGLFPISVNPNTNLNLTDNTFALNTNNVIEIRNGSIGINATWKKDTVPYVVTGDIEVRGYYYGEIGKLTIEPGCIIKFNSNTGLVIGYENFSFVYLGVLNAQGTSDDPILFTSNASSPAVGDWKGIYFKYTGNNTIMDYCEVEYADNNIYCDRSSPIIKNSTIQNSNNGIYISSSSSPSITCSNIKDNNTGVYATSSSNPSITGCKITGNAAYGVYNNNNSITINAENNWWGSASGPSGVGLGSGDAVSHYVDYDPWLTSTICQFDHFSFSPIAFPQVAGVPFEVTITAKDI